jgi:hypothetical protein
MAGQEVMITLGDLGGRLEIAERYGVRRNTVDLWLDRGVLPQPAPPIGRYISGNPAWVMAEVDRVLTATGRKVVNPDHTRLIGRYGLADLFAVPDDDVLQWERDETLPKPSAEVVPGHPLWKRQETIARVQERTGLTPKRNRA